MEAVTGQDAIAFMYEKEAQIATLTEELQGEQKKHRETLKKLRTLYLEKIAEGLLPKKDKLIAYASTDLSAEELVQLGQLLAARIDSGAIFLGAKTNDRIQVHLRLTPDMKKSAVDLIKAICVHIDGSGGGKADAAMAGGKNPAGFDKATTELRNLL
jgi:alanyl-tRNA synthetase